ncbi:MAG: hypothetical protein WCT03_08705 [Candidatus Obscuribacterales bacterium]
MSAKKGPSGKKQSGSQPKSSAPAQSGKAKTVGGQAMQAGADYQARVTAWFATQCLAEQDISDTLDLSVAFIPLTIEGESRAFIDDVVVGSRQSGTGYCQAKHTLSLGSQSDSELWKTAAQFVSQYRAGNTNAGGRAVDEQTDRFLIVTSSNSPDSLIKDLRSALCKFPTIRVGANRIPLLTKNEDAALTKFENAIKGAAVVPTVTDAEAKSILRLCRVLVLDLDDGDRDERGACDLLSFSILKNKDDAKAAFSVLFKESINFAKKGSGCSFAEVQAVLVKKNLPIKAIPAFQSDIAKLSKYATATVQSLSAHSGIEFKSATLKINREVESAIRQMAQQPGSLLIIGEPGSGKSGELHQLAAKLIASNHDVLCLAIDSMDVSSKHGLQADLGGLEHPLVEVLSNWPGVLPAFVIIDSLDSARSDTAQTTIRNLIKAVTDKCPRWRVVATVRKFDLKHGSTLADSFQGAPHPVFFDADFKNLKHVNVPSLSDAELAQVRSGAPDLMAAYDELNQDAQQLLRNVFNLRLFAEILGGGGQLADLQPVRTQVELLEKYWQRRVCDQGVAARNKRELALRQIADSMIANHSLRAKRVGSIDGSLTEALEDLMRIHLLRYPRLADNSADDERFIVFAHHVFFDFAVSKVWLSPNSSDLVKQLSNRSEFQILLRPSLMLYFDDLWRRSVPKREEFWSVVQTVARDSGIPALSKTVGPLVAARSATVMDDFVPLLSAVKSAKPDDAVLVDQLFKFVVRAALSLGGERLRKDAKLWLSVAKEFSTVKRVGVSYDAAYLLRTIVVDQS